MKHVLHYDLPDEADGEEDDEDEEDEAEKKGRKKVCLTDFTYILFNMDEQNQQTAGPKHCIV